MTVYSIVSSILFPPQVLQKCNAWGVVLSVFVSRFEPSGLQIEIKMRLAFGKPLVSLSPLGEIQSGELRI